MWQSSRFALKRNMKSSNYRRISFSLQTPLEEVKAMKLISRLMLAWSEATSFRCRLAELPKISTFVAGEFHITKTIPSERVGVDIWHLKVESA